MKIFQKTAATSMQMVWVLIDRSYAVWTLISWSHAVSKTYPTSLFVKLAYRLLMSMSMSAKLCPQNVGQKYHKVSRKSRFARAGATLWNGCSSASRCSKCWWPLKWILRASPGTLILSMVAWSSKPVECLRLLRGEALIPTDETSPDTWSAISAKI